MIGWSSGRSATLRWAASSLANRAAATPSSYLFRASIAWNSDATRG